MTEPRTFADIALHADIVREDLQALSPVLLAETDTATRQLAHIVERLAAQVSEMAERLTRTGERPMTHPLSTQALIERAATASNDPDLHHVEAAFRSARALALTSDHDHAADVAALEMALASAATLARRIYDHDDGLEDWLHRILAHFADDFGRIVGELERLADNDGDPAYRSDPADFVTP